MYPAMPNTSKSCSKPSNHDQLANLAVLLCEQSDHASLYGPESRRSELFMLCILLQVFCGILHVIRRYGVLNQQVLNEDVFSIL